MGSHGASASAAPINRSGVEDGEAGRHGADIMDARRLERVFRLRHQHSGEHAGPHGPPAFRAEDAGQHRLRPHPARARPDDVPLDDVLRMAGLSPGETHRPRRCLRAALGRQRAAYVRRYLRHHAADPRPHRRSGESLGSRPRLGVLPELHPDDRRVRRALYPQDHAPRGAARHAGRRLDRLHLDASGDGNLYDAGDRPRLLRHHPGELVRRRALSARHPGGACRDRGGHGHRLGLGGAGHRRRRHEPRQARRQLRQFRLLGAAAGGRPRLLAASSSSASSWSPPSRSASTTWSRRWTMSKARKPPATIIRRRGCSPPTASSA